MAERDPAVPQSDDPELQASLVRRLQIVGPLGRLNVADLVVPIISVGSVGAPSMSVLQPAFRERDVFSAGLQTAAPANFIHATTGNLPVGTYDIQLYISPHTTEAHVWQIRYITPIPAITTWSVIVPTNGPGIYQTLAFEFDEGALLQARNTTLFGAGVQSVATIFARLRT